MDYSVIIVAAGSGSRFQSKVNKVWLPLNGQPVLWHSLKIFLSDLDCHQVIVAVSKDDQFYVSELHEHFPTIETVWGGTCREESVYHALIHVKSSYVLIHDAARPYLTLTLLNKVKEALIIQDSIIPALPVKELSTPDRIIEVEGVSYRIQTPQGFRYSKLLEAFRRASDEECLHEFRDDASVLERYTGIQATLVKGDETNLKITYPEDLPKFSGV
jgi:2-C-methyl-D-erythritol 4-phosphate cytidylyltransferase